jgi:hypothetical protein
MAGIGRTLQIIGWLWLIAGFVGPRAGLPDVGIFPAFVLIFISRIFRKQARRNAPEEPDEEVEAEPPTPDRVLNTERAPRPSPSPEPVVRYFEPEPESDPEPEQAERNELLERIALAGRDATTEEDSPTDAEDAAADAIDVSGSMSSAEMIAQARKRWDRRT